MKNNLLFTLCLFTLWALCVSLPVSANTSTSPEKANPDLYHIGVSDVAESGRSYTLPFIENWGEGSFDHQTGHSTTI